MYKYSKIGHKLYRKLYNKSVHVDLFKTLKSKLQLFASTKYKHAKFQQHMMDIKKEAVTRKGRNNQ